MTDIFKSCQRATFGKTTFFLLLHFLHQTEVVMNREHLYFATGFWASNINYLPQKKEKKNKKQKWGRVCIKVLFVVRFLFFLRKNLNAVHVYWATSGRRQHEHKLIFFTKNNCHQNTLAIGNKQRTVWKQHNWSRRYGRFATTQSRAGVAIALCPRHSMFNYK